MDFFAWQSFITLFLSGGLIVCFVVKLVKITEVDIMEFKKRKMVAIYNRFYKIITFFECLTTFFFILPPNFSYVLFTFGAIISIYHYRKYYIRNGGVDIMDVQKGSEKLQLLLIAQLVWWLVIVIGIIVNICLESKARNLKRLQAFRY